MAEYINEVIHRYPELAPCRTSMELAVELILKSHASGGKILLVGNGGSCADCEHIAGELLKGFLLKRKPQGEDLDKLSPALGREDAELLQRGISAIPLPSISGALSAFANDVEPSLVFAQLVYAIGRAGDALLCLSTSGNSLNVVKAAECAKALGIKTIALTGRDGGKLAEICDVAIIAPEYDTYKIQELHLPIYHALCADVEEILFGEEGLNEFG
ncbi:MAG: SIS domain-containing protein [Clostridia bacterium]|nr:SIS domain-containing protein [Clostridia bacterium]